MSSPILSICIATFRRADFIAQTLDSIVGQLDDRVELVVLDGASPDATEAIVSGYASRHPQLRYRREPCNSGVDADYDKAVAQATGRYCWLMTDDDIVLPGAVARILEALDGSPDLLVLNAEVRTVGLDRVLQPRLLDVAADRCYGSVEREQAFVDLAPHLKFIGAVVIARDCWLARDRETYYGTLFVHVGVIFQPPALASVRVLADPVMVIRYGNAMWTARGFEIWMFLWPRLVWSFQAYSREARARVSAAEPWRKPAKLGVHRALGGYSPAVYQTYLAGMGAGPAKALAWLIARLPPTLANSLACLACLAMPVRSRLNLYDLARSPNATAASRWVARRLGVWTT